MEFDLNVDEKISLLHETAKTLLLKKMPTTEIVSALTKLNITADYAQMIIENVADEILDKKNFRKELVFGVMATAAGGFMTFVSYSTAGAGGIFFVTWGIMAFGISVILRAFILFKRK